MSQWENYADDSCGVCIEFDLEQDSLFRTLIQEGHIIPQCIVYDTTKVQEMVDQCYQIAEIIYENINKTKNRYDGLSLFTKIIGGGLIPLLTIGVLGCMLSLEEWKYNNLQFSEEKVAEILKEIIPYVKSVPTGVKTLEDIYLQLAQLLYPFVKAESFSIEKEMRFVYAKRKDTSYVKILHRIFDKKIIIPYVRAQDLISDVNAPRNLPITKIIIGSAVTDNYKIQSLKDFLKHKGLTHIKVEKSELSYRSLKKR